MALKRLNNDMRNEIVGNVVTKTFKSRYQDQAYRQVEIFGKIYDEATSPGFLEAVKKHPEWYPEAHRVDVVRPDKNDDDDFDIHVGTFNDAPKRVPYHMYNRWGQGKYKVSITDLSDFLQKEIEGFIAEDKKIELDKDALTLKVNGIVKSVTTVKKLIEIWPEVVKYYNFDTTQGSTLPAVQVEEVNEMIQKMAA